MKLRFYVLLVCSSYVLWGADEPAVNAASYGSVTECRTEILDSDKMIKCVNSNLEYTEREVLEPVLAGLRYFADSDKKLLDLLNKVRLRAVNPWTHNQNVNALALGLNSFTCLEPQINVDLGFVHELEGMAELVAVDKAGVPNAAEIANAYVSSYRRDVTKARTEGVPFFWPRFEVKTYARDWPFEIVRDLSVDITHELVAWTILHEVAHHYLGHTQSAVCGGERSITSLRKRRDAERDADFWAFDKLKTLGYQREALSNFLRWQKVNESIRRNVGIENSEELSDHPSWETRARLLEENFQVEEKQPFPYRSFFGYLFLDAKNHQVVQKIELSFLRSFDDGIYMGILFLRTPGADQETVPVLVEYVNQQVILHARFENIRVEHVVLEPDKLMTAIVLKTFVVGNKIPLSTVRLTGWSRGFAWMNKAKVGGVPLAVFMRSSPVEANLHILQELDHRPQIVAQAMDIVRQMMVVERDLAIDFIKGYRTLEESKAVTVREKERLQSRLRTLLGEPRFRAYQKAALELAYSRSQEAFALAKQKPEWINEMSNMINQELEAVR